MSGSSTAVTKSAGVSVAPAGTSGRVWRALTELTVVPVGRGPGVPGRTENLVVEFDEAYTAFVEGFETLPSEAQMVALQDMDSKLAAMVRAQDGTLWSDEARRTDPTWAEVRRLAEVAIRAFDWPYDVVDG